ncbi:MAG: hypothetical protein HQ522_13960 [Bacteroidetes bacterium]|nr:hypothetical protein [Bacteroidota bacterium]
MKYYEYNIGSDKIEFFNSYFGKETILVNGKKTSAKFSITGAEHKFKINSTEFEIITEYKLFDDHKFNLYLKKDGELIDLKYIELNKRYRLITIGIGVFIVFWMVKLYNSI